MQRHSGFVRACTALGLTGVLAAACVEQAEEKPSAEDMEEVKKNLLSAPPKPQFPSDGNLDDKVLYLGLDSSMNPIEPGKPVKLTHYWQVKKAPGAGWRYFTHIEGPERKGWINVDHGPVKGKYPVSQWKDGDIIRDEHTITLPATWSHDKLLVYVGLWRGQERMAVKTGAHDNGAGGGPPRLLGATIPVTATAPPPAAVAAKRYIIRKVSKAPKLDGKLDEAAWKDADSTGLFVNTMTGEPADHKTEAKLLWDKDNLYIAVQNTDSDVWTTLTKRDDKLWTQEAVEIMVDADKNAKTYVEFQVAPNGNIFDTYLPEWRKYEDAVDAKRKPYDWNSKIKAAVKVDGTLNKRDDQDKGWAVEIAIPHADVNGLSKEGVKAPVIGDSWRLNMFRLDAPEGKGQQASAWSPPLEGDFHALAKFGEVVFGDEKGQLPPAEGAPKPTVVKADAVKGALGELGAGTPGATDEKKPAARRKKVEK